MAKTIWVIDDDLGILEVIKIILTEQGYKVIAISDCEEIDNYLNGKLPNLILLDILMKGTDGLSIAKNMKNSIKTKHIPIVMVSADQKAEEKAKKAGANGLLKKPFNIDDLIAIVKKNLK